MRWGFDIVPNFWSDPASDIDREQEVFRTDESGSDKSTSEADHLLGGPVDIEDNEQEVFDLSDLTTFSLSLDQCPV